MGLRTVIPGGSESHGRQPSHEERRSAGGIVAEAAPESTGTTKAKVHRANAGLSKLQKGKICIVAREAFDRQVYAGVVEGGTDFNDWRHVEQFEAAGVSSLREAEQRHFNLILGHFLVLAGQEGEAFTRLMRGGGTSEDKRLALQKLKDACVLAEVNFPGYPATICKAQFKKSLFDADAGQLWCLHHTIMKRRNRKKQQTTHRNPKSKQ
ncbi:MAG: hypothetical protein AAGA96_09745 [Verrucomicrobiota bacterium]